MSQSSIAVMRWTVFGVMCTDSPDLHLALDQRVAFADLEQQPPRPEEDRFVLLVVILKAEGVAGVDVNQLADVPIGLRPVQLVAPRLLHSSSLHPPHITPPFALFDAASLAQLSFAPARLRRSRRAPFRLRPAVPARSARAAAARASAARRPRMTRLASGIAVGAMLNSRSPSPTSSVSSTGSAAISPQTATGMPRAPAGADDEADSAEDRRVQRFVEPRHAIVGAIDGEGVLDQIVGADAEEIGLARRAGRPSAPPTAPRSSRRSARPADCARLARAATRRRPRRRRRGRRAAPRGPRRTGT